MIIGEGKKQFLPTTPPPHNRKVSEKLFKVRAEKNQQNYLKSRMAHLQCAQIRAGKKQ
jgi:hypothetical protein